MTITFLTLFPDYFKSILNSSILKRAQERSVVTFNLINIRDYTTDKHRMADDRPFGGGAGMVMKIEPIDAAIQEWRNTHTSGNSIVVATSASGERFTQPMARQFAKVDNIAILCGHYEGIDQRVLDHLVDYEVRVGEYILTGGEPAAAVIADAVTRLVPGVLGNEYSIIGESHEVSGIGGYPQYTRPAVYKDWPVPEVLLTGNHKDIEAWRSQKRKKIAD